MADKPDILVLPVDPMHSVTGMLIPAISQRIFAFASERVSELDPTVQTRQLMARLYAGDQRLLILGMITTQGSLVGHLVAEILNDGYKNIWVMVLHCKADGNVGDAVKRARDYCDGWAKERGATFMLMATHRSDMAWDRKWGFETIRYVKRRELGAGSETEKD